MGIILAHLKKRINGKIMMLGVKGLRMELKSLEAMVKISNCMYAQLDHFNFYFV